MKLSFIQFSLQVLCVEIISNKLSAKSKIRVRVKKEEGGGEILKKIDRYLC